MNAALPHSTTTPLPVCPHRHAFHTARALAEKRTRMALLLTAITMLAEIVAGTVFGSMALLADGWHMGTHALALGLTAAAYWAARRYAADTRFAFGTWKIEVLAAYTSALMLAGVALTMVWESVQRLWHPVVIHFEQSMIVAVLGLVVNLLCLWMLHGASGHAQHDHHAHSGHHDHDHHHGHGHGHDLNLRSAVIHVATDAATSVLAIAALAAGMLWGLHWLDPVMGLVGAALIGVWAWGLLRETTRTLLDVTMHEPVVDDIRTAVADAAPHAQTLDLHVWKVGAGRYACLLSLAQASAADVQAVRHTLKRLPTLVHISIEQWPAAPAGTPQETQKSQDMQEVQKAVPSPHLP